MAVEAQGFVGLAMGRGRTRLTMPPNACSVYRARPMSPEDSPADLVGRQFELPPHAREDELRDAATRRTREGRQVELPFAGVVRVAEALGLPVEGRRRGRVELLPPPEPSLRAERPAGERMKAGHRPHPGGRGLSAGADPSQGVDPVLELLHGHIVGFAQSARKLRCERGHGTARVSTEAALFEAPESHDLLVFAEETVDVVAGGHGASVARPDGRGRVTAFCPASSVRFAMSDHKREVDKLRLEIAQLDEQLTATLEKRARAARSIGERVRGEAPTLPLRDRAFVETLIEHSKGDLTPDALRAIFREIQAACVGLELSVRVAVLAPEGGAGHAAAREQFGLGVACLMTASAEEALDVVERGRAEFAMLPYETSVEGPVQATILALTARELRIGLVREVVPTLHVWNRTGNLSEVTQIYAVAADRALAAKSLAEIPAVTVLDVKTPLAACQLAKEDPTVAALASDVAGVLMGLQVARRSMLDDSHGRVRYAIVGARPSPRTGEDCTSLVFSLHDAPGALLDVLRQFAEHGVNLSRIQSRPAEGDGWAYLFFLEVIGHATDRALVSAFEGVKRLTKLFKVLGSYPARS